MASGSLSDSQVGFLFSPQFLPYVGMGKVFYETFPCYTVVLDKTEAIYRRVTGKSLIEVLWDDPQSIHEAEVCAPGIFVTQVALAELLGQFGVKPMIVLGHSFGEYAAAVTSGVLSLEEAMEFVVGRAFLVKSKLSPGCLTALMATPEEVKTFIVEFEKLNGKPGPEIAAINGPCAVAVGGTFATISSFENFCAERGIKFMGVKAYHPYAYHTSGMDPILDCIMTLANNLTHAPPQITFVSSSTGQEEVKFGPEYWKRLTRNTVQFAKGVQTFATKNPKSVVEIGPSRVLGNILRRNFPEVVIPVYAVMEEAKDNVKSLLTCLCSLTLDGIQVNWNHWFEIDPLKTNNFGSFSIRAVEPGRLTRQIEEPKADVSLSSTEVEVDVIFCSLNYKDKGILERGNGPLGFDFSGIVRRVGHGVTTVEKGDKVYGMTLNGGALGSSCLVNHDTVAKISPGLTLASAATVPLSYTIAWHTLMELGGCGSGGTERILVNLSRGWIGIPLIALAHLIGAEVFALSSSEERTTFLKSAGVKHIYDQNNFVSNIKRDTQGQGLTLVINNFEIEMLKRESLDLVCPGGRFVDIAPTGHWTTDEVNTFRPDVTYSVLNFSDEAKGHMTSAWQTLVKKFESKAFTGIPAKCFPVDAITDVFDWFADGKLGMAKPLIQIASIPVSTD